MENIWKGTYDARNNSRNCRDCCDCYQYCCNSYQHMAKPKQKMNIKKATASPKVVVANLISH